MLGVAYKRNITDWRESPAVPIINGLIDRGARLDYQDNFVPSFALDGHGHGEHLTSVELYYSRIADYDCTLIVTVHDYFYVDQVLDHARRIVDTRNLTGTAGRLDPKVVKI